MPASDFADHGITVTGTGVASAVPDLFVIEVAAEVVAATPSDAFSGASSSLGAIHTAALAAGVARSDLRSGEMSLWTDHDREGVARGYRASLRLEVSVRDLAQAGTVLSLLVAAGGDAARVQSTRFAYSAPDALAASARDSAFAEAERRAGRYAELAGRPLGAVVSVVESDVEGGPRPMAALTAVGGASPPVSPGAFALTARVTVSWAWG